MDGAELFRARADWVSVVEAIYAPEPDDEDWARGVCERASGVFRRVDGVALYVVESDPARRQLSTRLAWQAGVAASFPEDMSAYAATDADIARIVEVYFDPPFVAGMHTELARHVPPAVRRAFAELREAFGFGDAVGLVGRPEPGVTITLGLTVDRPTRLTKYQRRLLSEIALHLESGYRLRAHPERVRAVLEPDGRVVHCDGQGSVDPKRMADHVKRLESSRARSARLEPGAIDVWTALVAGEVTAVEREVDGERAYAILDNPPSRRKHRALTRREGEIVRMAARGLPNKLIAYGLGLSWPTVSNALQSAAAKLGLTSRHELVRIASLLAGVERRPDAVAALTPAEREIFELVRRGLSNREIAQQRARSVRTVANQVAAVLRKTDSPTRRALVGMGMASSGRGE